jgi:predicted ArsR family transcriptional regulator
MTAAMSPERERPRQAAVLDALRAAGRPMGVAEVAERVGVHGNTARFHLDALVCAGAVVRTLEPPSGPGRPRTVYAPRPGMDRGGSRGYRLLAQILLGQLASAGSGAAESAADAARDWGRFLVERPAPSARLTGREAAARLTALLGELGFAPRPEPDTAAPRMIRLRHCPFLELAEEHGPLVCRIHLGLMQGALAELRAPLAATGLEPFAEPDACLVHLEHADAA